MRPFLTPDQRDRIDSLDAEWLEERAEELEAAWLAEMLVEFNAAFVAVMKRPVFEMQAIEELKKLKAENNG